MKKGLVTLGLTLCLLGTISQASFASTSVDSLIKKLVDKGILTDKEALDLKGEIATDEKMVREDGFKQGLPPWVLSTKLKGDLRVRYQYERKETDTDARARGRIRYRLGLENQINDKIKVGAGMASGEPKSPNSNDPRSTNASFQNTFERPEIRLDYAYAEYQAMESLKLVGGMFLRSDYLWAPTDMLWDGDVNPQGGALHWEHKLGEKLTPYVNAGVLMIDEVSSTTNDKVDPFVNYTQGGVKFQQGDWSANAAGVYYGFNGVKGSCPDWSGATNTGITSSSNGTCTGALTRDYDSVGASAELALATPFDMASIPEVGIFGDFIHNVDGNKVDNAAGWSMGARLGDKKVVSKGQWQLKYIFARLGKDAFVDFTPDSDRYGGKTDVQSHEGILEYGLNKNVSLALDYYQSSRIKAAKASEHVIQADVNLKF